MARPKSLATLSFDALVKLRDDVTEMLTSQVAAMQRQLAAFGPGVSGGYVGNGRRMSAKVKGRKRGSSLKGRKVPPKYRGSGGETWAGRGARPRWLVAALKGGKKLDSFLIKRKTKR